jgi:hypothetical protein
MRCLQQVLPILLVVTGRFEGEVPSERMEPGSVNLLPFFSAILALFSANMHHAS